MSAYVEASPRARQIFFLTVILWGGLVVGLYRLEESLPPLSNDAVEAMDQVLGRSFVAAFILSAFYVALSGVAIWLARRSAQSSQWPPKGIEVPFRTRVIEVKKKGHVLLYLAAILSLFTFQAASPWVRYAKQRTQFEEFKQMIKEVPNKSLNQTPLSLAPLHAAATARVS